MLVRWSHKRHVHYFGEARRVPKRRVFQNHPPDYRCPRRTQENGNLLGAVWCAIQVQPSKSPSTAKIMESDTTTTCRANTYTETLPPLFDPVIRHQQQQSTPDDGTRNHSDKGRSFAVPVLGACSYEVLFFIYHPTVRLDKNTNS